MKQLRRKFFFIYYHTNTTGRIVLNLLLLAFIVLAWFNSKADDMYLAFWIMVGLFAFWIGKSWVDETWIATRDEWNKKKQDGSL